MLPWRLARRYGSGELSAHHGPERPFCPMFPLAVRQRWSGAAPAAAFPPDRALQAEAGELHRHATAALP